MPPSCECTSTEPHRRQQSTGSGNWPASKARGPTSVEAQCKDAIYLSPYLYRAPNLLERFFNKNKLRRRVAARYDRLAAAYRAFVKLGSVRIWLRANESAP